MRIDDGGGTGDLYAAQAAAAAAQAAAQAAAEQAAEEAARQAAEEAQKAAEEQAKQEIEAQRAQMSDQTVEAGKFSQASMDRASAYQDQPITQQDIAQQVAADQAAKAIPAQPADAKPASKPDDGGFFGSIGRAVSDAWNAGGHIVKQAETAIEAGAHELASKVIDPAMDGALGKQHDEFKDEKTGELGDLVTNRLDVGQSAYVKLSADTTIEGIQVGAGAEMQVKRVPVTDDQGNAVTGADGKPQTNLQVTLVADAKVGVGLKVGSALGKGAGDVGDGKTIGAEAGVNASASVGLEGKAVFRFNFDPKNQQDMNDMTGIFKSAAKTGLEAQIPGIGAVLAASNAPDLAKDASAFARHLTEVQGEAGVYAKASAGASLKAGAVNNSDADGTQEKKGGLASMALDKANINLASLTASLGGDVKVGADYHAKTGDTTVYLTADYSAKANASAGVGEAKLKEGMGVAGGETLALTIGKDGQIKDAQVQQYQTKETLTQAQISAMHLRGDAIGQLSKSDTVTSTYSMDATQLDALKSQLKNDPLQAVGTLAQSAIHPDPLTLTDVRGTHTTEANLGFNVGAGAFSLGINATLGKATEVELSEAAHNWNQTLFNDPTTRIQ